jgi:hypothetical protein
LSETRGRSVVITHSAARLAWSGRVADQVAWDGPATGVPPLHPFTHGKTRPRRPALSADAASESLRAKCRRSHPNRPARLHPAVLTSGADGEAYAMCSDGARPGAAADGFVARSSSVRVAHVRPGLWGLGWWWDTTAA